MKEALKTAGIAGVIGSGLSHVSNITTGALGAIGVITLRARKAAHDLINPQDKTPLDEYLVKDPLQSMSDVIIGSASAATLISLLGGLGGTVGGAVLSQKILQNRGKITQTLGMFVGAGAGLAVGTAGAITAGAVAGGAGMIFASTAKKQKEAQQIISGDRRRKRGVGSTLAHFDGAKGCWQNASERNEMIESFREILAQIKNIHLDPEIRNDALKKLQTYLPVHFDSIDNGDIPSATKEGVVELFNIASHALYTDKKDKKNTTISDADKNVTLHKMLQSAWNLHNSDITEMLSTEDVRGINPTHAIPHWALHSLTRNAVYKHPQIANFIKTSILNRGMISNATRARIAFSENFSQICNDNIVDILSAIGRSAPPLLSETQIGERLIPEIFDTGGHFQTLITVIKATGSSSMFNTSTNENLAKIPFRTLYNSLNATEQATLWSSIHPTVSDLQEKYQNKAEELFNLLSPADQNTLRLTWIPSDHDLEAKLNDMDPNTIVSNLLSSEQRALFGSINTQFKEDVFSTVQKEVPPGIKVDQSTPLVHNFSNMSKRADKRVITDTEAIQGEDQEPTNALEKLQKTFGSTDLGSLILKANGLKETIEQLLSIMKHTRDSIFRNTSSPNPSPS